MPRFHHIIMFMKIHSLPCDRITIDERYSLLLCLDIKPSVASTRRRATLIFIIPIYQKHEGNKPPRDNGSLERRGNLRQDPLFIHREQQFLLPAYLLNASVLFSNALRCFSVSGGVEASSARLHYDKATEGISGPLFIQWHENLFNSSNCRSTLVTRVSLIKSVLSPWCPLSRTG